MEAMFRNNGFHRKENDNVTAGDHDNVTMFLF